MIIKAEIRDRFVTEREVQIKMIVNTQVRQFYLPIEEAQSFVDYLNAYESVDVKHTTPGITPIGRDRK